jgi:hypothetical protein
MHTHPTPACPIHLLCSKCGVTLLLHAQTTTTTRGVFCLLAVVHALEGMLSMAYHVQGEARRMLSWCVWVGRGVETCDVWEAWGGVNGLGGWDWIGLDGGVDV